MKFLKVNLTNIPVIITEEFLLKVKFLCARIYDVEWSGILFYSVKGDIKDVSNMEITVQDILPMNKGTKAYTAFKEDNRFVTYMMDKPEAMEWETGLIHSHNTMGVFFSGTDDSELFDNADKYNFYLSLIVNNFMEMTAKIGVYVESKLNIKKIKYTALDIEGNPYTCFEQPLEQTLKGVITYNCKIVKPEETLVRDTGFEKSVMRIIKDAEPKKFSNPVGYKSQNFVPGTNFPIQYQNPINKNISKQHVKSKPFSWSAPEEIEDLSESFSDTDLDLEEELTEIQQFILTVLGGGIFNEELSCLEDMFEEILATDVDVSILATSFIDTYPKVFDDYFEHKTPEYFTVITEEVIEELDRYTSYFDLTTPIKNSLENMLHKFITNGK